MPRAIERRAGNRPVRPSYAARPPETSVRRWAALALAVLLAFGLLTLWVTARWAAGVVEVGIHALVIVWLAGALWRGFPVRLQPILIPLGGAVAWGVMQIATERTVYAWETERMTLEWLTRLAALFLAMQLFSEDTVRSRFLRGLLWFGFVLSVAAILQRFTAPHRIFWLFETPLEGVMGPFVYHNQYAAFVELVMPLALLGAALRPGERWIYAAIAAALAASVVAANSRAGAALVMAEIGVVAMALRRRMGISWRQLALGTAAVLLLLAVFAGAVGWAPLFEKLRREDQLAERRELMLSTAEMARERPLFGFGLGTWATAYPAYARFDDGRRDNQAHNDWLQWAAEGGLPFLALMLLMAGMLAGPAWRSGWGVGLLAVLVHCLVDYHFQQRPVFGYLYFVLAGVVLVSAPAAQDRADRAGQDH